MDPPKDFTIDKVSWHTSVAGNPETPDKILLRFKIIVDFLQQNNLTVRQLLAPDELPTNDFSFRKSDLTEEGYQVIKLGYDKWLKKVVNKGKSYFDLSILEQALAKVREG